MSSNWVHLKFAAYTVSHTMLAENDDKILKSMKGGEIPLTAKVKSHIQRLEDNSKINSSIFFTKDSEVSSEKIVNANSEGGQTVLLASSESLDGGIEESELSSTTYSAKYLLEQICLHEEYELIEQLPLKLVKSIDKRINDGLLVILISKDLDDVVSRRINLWYLPLSEGGFSLFKDKGGCVIELVEEVYIDVGKKFKAASFEGNSRRNFTDLKVSDNSVTGSRYWVETFLDASFELDSPQIQKKLASSMKKLASSSPVQPKEFNERNEDGLVMVEDEEWEPAFDFSSAIDNINELDDEEEITIDRFVEEYVPEPHKEKVTKSFPEEVRNVPFQAKSTKETFQTQFRRKKIRAILSDDSVIEIIGTREDIEKHLKVNKSNNKITFTLEATETIEDLMR